MSQMGLDELQRLPVTVDVPTAGRAFGLGRNRAYELARNGGFPCPVLRFGRTVRVKRADLLRALGHGDSSQQAG